MSNNSQPRAKAVACPYCQLNDRTQHSLKRAGQCDGIRKGHLYVSEQRPFTVAKVGEAA